MPFICTSCKRKGGGDKGRPVKIIIDNDVENTVVRDFSSIQPHCASAKHDRISLVQDKTSFISIIFINVYYTRNSCTHPK